MDAHCPAPPRSDSAGLAPTPRVLPPPQLPGDANAAGPQAGLGIKALRHASQIWLETHSQRTPPCAPGLKRC